MNIPQIIERKRDGFAHSRQEIEQLVLGFVEGEVPDYQIAAWLMAVFLRGLNAEETAVLTEVMAASGEQLDLSNFEMTVDKHSTGGVGDKTSLVVAPILAACGCTVAKMSGRGLAHTGGTIDKLESIPGWRAELSDAEFFQQAKEIGFVLISQSKNLAPADGLLYALRDVTGTVPSLPLIAASIMSKKLAAGAKTIVLDVKCGHGAFMKTEQDARNLAQAMIDIGQRAGRKVRAIISDMNAPLGRTIGNALEVKEAVETLKNHGPDDLTELALRLSELALLANGLSEKDAHEKPRQALSSGKAFVKFLEFVKAQGGDADYVSQMRFEIAPNHLEIKAEAAGYLELDALLLGQAALALGAGRTKKGEAIDFSVGIELLAKHGEKVQIGQPLLKLYHQNRGLSESVEIAKKAINLAAFSAEKPLILGIL